MGRPQWYRMMYLGSLTFSLAKTVLATPANTVLAPWATPATSWMTTITSVWVPIIFTVITVGILIANRYMGDQDSWMSSMLSVLVKASIAANALAIVGFFTLGGTGTGPLAATPDDILPLLEP